MVFALFAAAVQLSGQFSGQLSAVPTQQLPKPEEASGISLPPYKITARLKLFEGTSEPEMVVHEETLYAFYTDFDDRMVCAAVDLRTMKEKWRFMPPVEFGDISVSASNSREVLISQSPMYVFSDEERETARTVVHCLDAQTGKVKWTLKYPKVRSQVKVVGETMYLATKPYTYSAIDTQTRKVLWTTPLLTAKEIKAIPKNKEESRYVPGSVQNHLDAGSNLLVKCGKSIIALEEKTGRRLWNISLGEAWNLPTPTALNVVCIPHKKGSAGVSTRTGKILWTQPKLWAGSVEVAFGGNFVGRIRGKLEGLDPFTGRTVWSHKIGDPMQSSGGDHCSVLGNTLFAQEIDGMMCDEKGRVRWTGDVSDLPGNPVARVGNDLVMQRGGTLLRAVHAPAGYFEVLNTLPTDPNERRTLAETLVAKITDLDPHEEKQLTDLGDDAFEPLFRAYLEFYKDRKPLEYDDPREFRGQKLAEYLPKAARAKHVPQIIAAHRQMPSKSEGRYVLSSICARVGDTELVTSYFMELVEKQSPEGFQLYDSDSYITQTYIINSSDPRAVDYKLRLLAAPDDKLNLKPRIYQTVAGNGGQRGVDAVLALRKKRTLLRPLSVRVTEGFIGGDDHGKDVKPLSQKKDAKGRTWGLLQSEMLGNEGDLWLCQLQSGKWVKPVFTGLSTNAPSRWIKSPPPLPRLGGFTGKEILKQNWLPILVGNAKLAQDTDGDSLTDLVEGRLGTNPAKADTDGDGDLDGVDPCPTAAPRQLTDEEEVLYATFEARNHFDQGESPGIFLAPKGMKPFEMVGWTGPLLWGTDDERWSHPLERCYEYGIALIRTYGLRWNADRTEAELTISQYYGGLSGTGYYSRVRKFGDKWVVVTMGMSSIS